MAAAIRNRAGDSKQRQLDTAQRPEVRHRTIAGRDPVEARTGTCGDDVAGHEATAVCLHPDLLLGHAVLGDALGCKQRFEESISEFERALELNPNFSYFHYSMVLVMAGEHLRAVEVVKAHTRLDPFYEPLAPFMLGMALYMLRNYAEAVVALRETVLRAPRFMQGHLWLAATYAQMGLLDEARGQAAQALAILPSYALPTSTPFKRRADAEHILDGLRKAGLPER